MKWITFAILALFCLPLIHKEEFKYAKYITKEQLNCLVKNAYYESRGEGTMGVMLVTKVVLNRTFDNDYCKTIYKYKQFSWTLKTQKQMSQIEKEKITILVLLFYNGYLKVPKEFENATHFHATYVKPSWAKKLKFLGKWENHLFYQQGV